MSDSLLVPLLAFVALSLLMVLALVPFSLELIEPSADMPAHRARMRRMNPVSRATQAMVPSIFDAVRPARVWGVAYALIWLGLVISGGLMIWTEPQHRTKNLLVLALVTLGFMVVHAAIVWLGRAIVRANQRDGVSVSVEAAEAGPVDEIDEPEETDEPIEVTPRDEPARPESSGLAAKLFGFVRLLVMFGIVIVAIVIAEVIRPVVDLEAVIARHRGVLLPAVIGLAAVGFALFMWCSIQLALGNTGGRARAMTHGEVERMKAQHMPVMTQPSVARGAAYRIAGKTHGRTGADEFSIHSMKLAWRARAWRYDPVWRRRFLTFAGAMSMSLGIFGIIMVTGPAWIIVLLGAALTYAFVRITWAFWRA